VARPGILPGEGRIVSRGRSIAVLSGELTTEAGELVATATAPARVVSGG
jgi:acyl-coenzyme A thioesterase PaaI-like protein